MAYASAGTGADTRHFIHKSYRPARKQIEKYAQWRYLPLEGIFTDSTHKIPPTWVELNSFTNIFVHLIPLCFCKNINLLLNLIKLRDIFFYWWSNLEIIMYSLELSSGWQRQKILILSLFFFDSNSFLKKSHLLMELNQLDSNGTRFLG